MATRPAIFKWRQTSTCSASFHTFGHQCRPAQMGHYAELIQIRMRQMGW
jgi:hypothetical protein